MLVCISVGPQVLQHDVERMDWFTAATACSICRRRSSSCRRSCRRCLTAVTIIRLQAQTAPTTTTTETGTSTMRTSRSTVHSSPSSIIIIIIIIIISLIQELTKRNFERQLINMSLKSSLFRKLLPSVLKGNEREWQRDWRLCLWSVLSGRSLWRTWWRLLSIFKKRLSSMSAASWDSVGSLCREKKNQRRQQETYSQFTPPDITQLGGEEFWMSSRWLQRHTVR